ncbi:MAG TPA: hypothetical protein VG605_03585 [Puia sp.]|nr:hypothetical protein [Puia sp.]
MRKQALTTLTLIILLTGRLAAQTSILNRQITFECRQQPIGRVLDLISQTGNFYFSYASLLINKDSLVSLPQQTRSIREFLDQLFKGRLQYREDGRYLILLPAAIRNTSVVPAPDKRFLISGTIVDQRTGTAIGDVSVYDPNELVATLSHKDGRFTIRVRNRDWPIILTVSKESYTDTIIELQPGSSRDLTIGISPDAFPPKALLLSPQNPWTDDSIRIQWNDDSLINSAGTRELVHGVETTRFARIVISYRLRIQSINLRKYFIQRPVQVSLVPGLSTNGRMNAQVTNKFSVNLAGGYSAGLRGVELGGVFNIDRKSVAGMQAAGVINVVGDSVRGVQLAGVLNKDLDSVKGIQAAGVANSARQIRGLQIAGVYNSADKVYGVQESGLINRTRHLHGVQLGLINIADTSDGISIGLLSIVKHGLHELSFYMDEWSPVNLALRTGTPRFYSILLAGLNPGRQRRSYYYGYGFGHQQHLSKTLSLRFEGTALNVSPVDFRHFADNNMAIRFNVDLHWQPARNFGITAGPSLTAYQSDHNYYIDGQLYQPLPKGYSTRTIGEGRAIGWIGWRVAVNLF